MPTLTSGTAVSLSATLDTTIVVRPAETAGARVSLSGTGADGVAMADRMITSVTSISLGAGDIITLTARGGDGSYTSTSPVRTATRLGSWWERAAQSGPALVAALGDSNTSNACLSGVTVNQIAYASQGFLTWMMALSGGSLWCPLVGAIGTAGALLNYNRAVTGETAAQIRDRVLELDALPVKPRFCTVLAGTNNLTVNTAQAAGSIAAEITGTCADILLRGITPVLFTLLPRGNSTTDGWGSLTAGQIRTARGRLLEVNRILRSYAAATPGVILVDAYSALADLSDATSDANVAWQPFYLHTNALGALKVGKVGWDAVAPFVAPAPDYYMGAGDAYDATEDYYGSMLTASYSANGGTATSPVVAAAAWAGTTLYVAGTLVTTGGRLYFCTTTGTSGSADPIHETGKALDGSAVWECVGLVATGGTPAGLTANKLSGSTSSATIARQSRMDGRNGYEMVLGLVGADTATFRSYVGDSTLANANFVAGDAIYAEQDVVFNGPGAGQYGNPDITIRWNSAAVVCWAALNAAGAQGDVAGVYSLRLRTPLMVIPAAGINGFNAWSVDGIKNTGAACVTRRPLTIRKFNKNAPGAITW